ncbi:MAG: helix-turn-helix transcriptional regulator [Sphingopyxis sp.]|nr:helix-turn-helix transcriptional regulator [Sphingopyxis sp.]
MVRPINIADYDAVVSDIYEAALSPARWDVALTNLVGRFGRDHWDVAMLVWERLQPPAGRFIGASGVHEMARTGYVHMFAGRNEWSIRGHDLPIGTVLHSDEMLTRDELRAGAFYQQYLANYNMEVAIVASLDRHGDDHLGLCLPGPDNGPVDRLQQAVKLLLPHIQRSARIARRIGEAELAASQARAVLDRAPSAILMCDGSMRLTYANPHGEALLRDGYVWVQAGRLAIPSRRQTAVLKSLFDPGSAIRCATLYFEPDDAPAVTAMAMRLDTPASGGISDDFGGAQVMIVAGVNHRASFANVEQLREWFALTPTEARLAATLAEGGSLDDFSRSRGVSVNASRFLLRGVFAKTATSRQAQLVAKLRSTPIQWQGGDSIEGLPRPID